MQGAIDNSVAGWLVFDSNITDSFSLLTCGVE